MTEKALRKNRCRAEKKAYHLAFHTKIMYFYIGNNKSVRGCDILGVFDMDTSTVSTHTRKYLNEAQRAGKLIVLGYDLPKSFILMKDKSVYLSPLNTSTIIGKN